MANEQTTTAVTTSPTGTTKTPCGCTSTDATKSHDDDDCPCKRRERMKKMVIGGVILVVLGVAAYGAWKMGYFEKVTAFIKKQVKKIG